MKKAQVEVPGMQNLLTAQFRNQQDPLDTVSGPVGYCYEECTAVPETVRTVSNSQQASTGEGARTQ